MINFSQLNSYSFRNLFLNFTFTYRIEKITLLHIILYHHTVLFKSWFTFLILLFSIFFHLSQAFYLPFSYFCSSSTMEKPFKKLKAASSPSTSSSKSSFRRKFHSKEEKEMRCLNSFPMSKDEGFS